MEHHVDLITLGVSDLDASRRFYVDGMGWDVALDVPGEVVFLRAGHSRMLALFGADDLAADMNAPARGTPDASLSIAQILETEEEVRETLDRARAAGARILKPAEHAVWGGYHGYFADPDGFAWEIAVNPGWRVDADGTPHIGAASG